MGIGIFAGLMAGALWGLVFVAPRMVPSISGVDFTAGRFVSYGILAFALIMLAKNKPWPTWVQARSAVLLSVLGFTGYYLLLVYGIQDAGTEVPSLIIGTIPLWMMILGKPAGLTWKSLIPGLILTGCGLALMMTASHDAGTSTGAANEHPHFWRGVAYSLASMACWTAFGLMNAKWLKDHPEVSATTWANWLGVATGLGALVLWFIAGSEPKVLLASKEIALAAMLSVATGIGSAWIATILWNIASQRLSASLCGQLIVSETIFALIYSFMWDGQWPSAMQWIATALFVAGILASIRAHR
ncbi:DMT family transporter [Variovorax sp. PCZ-1]|uniref:DMT family transporter n=1 Tax=Variovorax sp. PCZ-1 TaxID=2835533 RepID=UPI001BCE80DE|nr:DMT family transporter [Variovorax sp. PCZ-1]MBS7807553.1 DMT family transporter [Variovorax sp. PCZ-1]